MGGCGKGLGDAVVTHGAVGALPRGEGGQRDGWQAGVDEGLDYVVVEPSDAATDVAEAKRVTPVRMVRSVKSLLHRELLGLRRRDRLVSRRTKKATVTTTTPRLCVELEPENVQKIQHHEQ